MDPIVKPIIPAKIMYARQQQWIGIHSKPRRMLKPPPIDRGPMFSNTARLEELAAPLHPHTKPKKIPVVAEAAMNYTASGRITELAMPRLDRSIPKRIPQMPSANLSGRMQQLCQPRWPYHKEKPKPLVSLNAMTCSPSQRVKELAEHRNRPKVEANEFAFTVNPVAIKYFPSQRTRLMARPHDAWTEKDFDARYAAQRARKAAYDQKRAAKLAADRERIEARHKNEQKSLGL